MSSEVALQRLFDWFNANGGTTRTTRTAPSVPGLTTRIGDRIISPSADEFTVGLARALGSRGTARVDYIYRDYNDFYSDRRDMTTGRVTDQFGREFDLILVENTNKVDRTYKGVSSQVSYRFGTRTNVGANYTLSWSRGNFTGETAGSGPDRANPDDFPEYREARWNTPVGYTSNDQRHKLRAWASYDVPAPRTVGRFTLGLLQRFDSGTPYSADGAVDPRPYVVNPGYVNATSSVTYYFSGRGEFRNDDLWRTDFSLMWSYGMPRVARGEIFFRGVVTNLFNRSGLVTVNNQVVSRSTNSSYPAFNPFTETPVRGVHWDYGPDWGKPTGVGDYQAPREFSFSFGVRF